MDSRFARDTHYNVRMGAAPLFPYHFLCNFRSQPRPHYECVASSSSANGELDSIKARFSIVLLLRASFECSIMTSTRERDGGNTGTNAVCGEPMPKTGPWSQTRVRTSADSQSLEMGILDASERAGWDGITTSRIPSCKLALMSLGFTPCGIETRR